ncbi:MULTISPECIES: hypothetical protein [Alphaproteobacteria]|uniref:hypothetical protein n=1 Tax=Alphaproteobacteria TaxID=28211 RepID=UPI0014796F55|nr:MULTISPECIES: hypothetical protein [Alphaproteobacteria]
MVQNRRTAKKLSGGKKDFADRAIAGQNETEPKEKPRNGGVMPLEFFHWRTP